MGVFHDALGNGGFLFLGGAENVSQHADLYRPIDKMQRIFQRRDHVSRPLSLPSLGRLRMTRAGTDAQDEPPLSGAPLPACGRAPRDGSARSATCSGGWRR